MITFINPTVNQIIAMRKSFCCFLILLTLMLSSCGRKSGSSVSDASDNRESVALPAPALSGLHVEAADFSPHSFLLTEKTLPAEVDLTTDISAMTYAELRLMKSYVYATHGLWLMDEELNKFFQTKCEWYEPKCYTYLETHNWEALTDYDKAGLSLAEQAFVDSISSRMQAMERYRAVKCEGHNLLNPALTVNMFQLDTYKQTFYEHLNNANFCITPSDMQQLFNVYEVNDYQCIPNYVTTDVYLQVFHMYFSYVLKSLERHHLAARLHEVCRLMNERALNFAEKSSDDFARDLASFNAAFFAIADRLLTGESALPIPDDYRAKVDAELRNIEAGKPAHSPMMTWLDVYFNYDLFSPRGHYTRTESEMRYFRAMMWLQTCTFCRESRQATQYAAMMALIIRSFQLAGTPVGEDINETLTFLMGEPDNVSVFDVARLLDKGRIASPSDLADADKLAWLDGELKRLFADRNRISPKVAAPSCTDKLNYMPQRYAPDAEVLNRMYDESPNAKRAYPSGLDVFAAFGSAEADHILNNVYDVSKQWGAYRDEASAVRKQFEGYNSWDRSVYNKWMQSLVALQNEDKNQPAYMQTSHWRRKNLNTALASWSELKHDAVLYSEQPFAAECGGGGDLPDPVLVGYVEPNLAFWQRLRELLNLTRDLLDRHGFLDEALRERTEQLAENIDFCIDVSRRELEGVPLEERQYRAIKYIGSSLEWFTLSVIDPDVQPDSWELVQGPERSVALVSDVFTRNVTNCTKNGVLHEATGNADAIYVLVDIGSRTYLTRGAVFSYFEFVEPPATRLTDEAWQQRLDEGKMPPRPEWMQPYIINDKPTVNEGAFYGSGC